MIDCIVAMQLSWLLCDRHFCYATVSVLLGNFKLNVTSTNWHLDQGSVPSKNEIATVDGMLANAPRVRTNVPFLA